MAKTIKPQSNEVILMLRSEEYAALQSLLYEFQDIDRLKKFAKDSELELSSAHITRIAGMWKDLNITEPA